MRSFKARDWGRRRVRRDPEAVAVVAHISVPGGGGRRSTRRRSPTRITAKIANRPSPGQRRAAFGQPIVRDRSICSLDINGRSAVGLRKCLRQSAHPIKCPFLVDFNRHMMGLLNADALKPNGLLAGRTRNGAHARAKHGLFSFPINLPGSGCGYDLSMSAVALDVRYIKANRLISSGNKRHRRNHAFFGELGQVPGPVTVT